MIAAARKAASSPVVISEDRARPLLLQVPDGDCTGGASGQDVIRFVVPGEGADFCARRLTICPRLYNKATITAVRQPMQATSCLSKQVDKACL